MTFHTLWMQPSGADPDITPSAQEFRALVTALTGSANSVFAGGFAVTQRGAGANFSVDIAPGFGAVAGDDVSNQNAYLVWNDATANLATPTAPGSGTRTHRVVLQVRDKLANGIYSTYDCVPLCLADTGTGEPAEPNSAMTLAHVAETATTTSILNANITDARPAPPLQLGGASGGTLLAAYKPANTSRASTTTPSPDPDLAVTLAANAVYQVQAHILGFCTSGGIDMNWSWTVPSGATGTYSAAYDRSGGSGPSVDAWAWANTPSAIALAAGVNAGTVIAGTVITATTPGTMSFNWAQHVSSGTNITVWAGSHLILTRIK